MKIMCATTCIAVMLAYCQPSVGAELAAKDIVHKAYAKFRSLASEKENIQLTVNGKVKKLYRWTKLAANYEDRNTIKYYDPADEKWALLTKRLASGGSSQTVKIPGQTRSRQLSIGDYGKSFAGTGFSYEDIWSLLGEKTDEFDYRLMDKQGSLQVVEATPKPVIKSAYEKRVLKINDKFQVVEISYYDRSGEVKTLKNSGFVEYGEAWRANSVVVEDKRQGRLTEVKVLKRETVPVSDSFFDVEFIESERM